MKRLAPLALSVVLISASGCHMFSKKAAAPKVNNKDLAKQVEQEFKQRWIEKRSSELVAQGKSPAEAGNQALAEYTQRFAYTQALPAPVTPN